MIYYETMYIVHPALEAGRLKDLILSIEKTLLNLGGKTSAINVWGKKKLAYPINKEKYGMYILFQFQNSGAMNKEFNLSLEHNSNILAYLTTKIDQDEIIADLPSLDVQLGLLNADAEKDNKANASSNINDTASNESESKTTEFDNDENSQDTPQEQSAIEEKTEESIKEESTAKEDK